MKKQERYTGIVDYFSTHLPNPETELQYTNPYELIVAVVLSAQCTDKRVNMVTPYLFDAYPTASALASATPDEVFQIIRSISYPNNKAKHLVGLGKMLIDEFNNVVPGEIDQLVKLPGVGRKTANVIASVIHNLPTMAVDTHVFRVSHRLGLVSPKSKTPLAVEKELVKNFTDEQIPKAHHWLILHGRYTCLARNPKCGECGITDFCKSFEKIQKHGIKAVDEKLPKIG
ncbi:endonuclease III [Jiulongibacter sediminis]|jgi:endonuclease-3|uniref:Endonuclease III n=1 Tax=Jiulongibacter sediminis TaxID=1605367 RepID=A0A0P7BQ79_9BACT|nr:endonuclease III [Jiulongibacter sediminis]KPM49294.1 endonuclease III [Jiulongibacter sediminis]TBX26346.1 endonuclease III [Jiulongibacter sediminis]